MANPQCPSGGHLKSICWHCAADGPGAWRSPKGQGLEVTLLLSLLCAPSTTEDLNLLVYNVSRQSFCLGLYCPTDGSLCCWCAYVVVRVNRQQRETKQEDVWIKPEKMREGTWREGWYVYFNLWLEIYYIMGISHFCCSLRNMNWWFTKLCLRAGYSVFIVFTEVHVASSFFSPPPQRLLIRKLFFFSAFPFLGETLVFRVCWWSCVPSLPSCIY